MQYNTVGSEGLPWAGMSWGPPLSRKTVDSALGRLVGGPRGPYSGILEVYVPTGTVHVLRRSLPAPI